MLSTFLLQSTPSTMAPADRWVGEGEHICGGPGVASGAHPAHRLVSALCCTFTSSQAPTQRSSTLITHNLLRPGVLPHGVAIEASKHTTRTLCAGPSVLFFGRFPGGRDACAQHTTTEAMSWWL